MLKRIAIREAVKAALLNKTPAAARVQASRPNPIQQNPTWIQDNTQLPRIIIYTRNTKSSVFDESPRRYRHETELRVECVTEVLAEQDIDITLDNFEQTALDAILADDTLGGVVDDTMLSESSSEIDGDGDRLIAGVVLAFTVVYYTNAPEASAQTLDDFETMNIQYNLAGQQPDPADRAETIIEGLEA